MMKLKTKEHLIFFMQSGMMKLNSFDLKFCQNISERINGTGSITTNQVSLFDKLIQKYHKQLTELKFNTDVLANLPWTCKIIESDSSFTEPHIKIVNDEIIFTSPFNRKFLAELRSCDPDPFVWDRDKRYHHCRYSTYAFKILVKTLNKFYKKINFCPTSAKLLKNLDHYTGDEIWEPTLVRVGKLLLIGAINDSLSTAISKLNIETTMDCFSQLSQYGVRVSPSVTTDLKLIFSNSYIYEIDVNSLDQTIDWLSELGCDCVFFSGLLINSDLRKKLFHKLNLLNITTHNTTDILLHNNRRSNKTYNYPVTITFHNIGPRDVVRSRKIIRVTNSTAIKTK